MTKGTKKILENKNAKNIEKFWELNKIQKLQDRENKIRTQELMSKVAKLAIEQNEIDNQNKFYEFVKKYATGVTITNSFNRKLFFKLGE